MGIRELRKEASRLGIKNYSKMRKAELQAAVDGASGIVESTNVTLPTKGDSVSAQPEPQVIAGRSVVGDEIDGQPAVNVLAGMAKGDARRLRKALRAAGRVDLASLDVRIAFATSAVA